MNPEHYRTVEDRTKTEDEIKKAEQHEVLKQDAIASAG